MDGGHRVLERLAVEVRNDRVAGGARLLARALLQSAPDAAHEGARLARRVPEDVPVLGRQAFPRAQRHDKYFRAIVCLGRVVYGAGLEWVVVAVGGPVFSAASARRGR